jgi:hypothetical protein
VILTRPLQEARRRLAVGADADRRAIKRAYRRAVAEHPPDRDPEAFRQIREAYELLCAPELALGKQLVHPLPLVAPPKPPAVEDPAPSGTLAVALLRAAVARVDAQGLLPAAALEQPANDDPDGQGKRA